MKKMLFAILIAMVACMSQAAALNWSVSQIKSSSDSTAAGSGYMGYFFEVGGDLSKDSIVALLDGGDYASAIAKASYSKAATATGTINSTGNGAYAAGTSVTGFAVIFDAASPADASNYIVTSELTKTAAATGNMAFAFGSQANATYSSVGGGEGTPEPTSGLLLLIGGAMLALRRKQK